VGRPEAGGLLIGFGHSCEPAFARLPRVLNARICCDGCGIPRLSLSADDGDQSGDKFCETQWMARTDDEKWLVVDSPRRQRTDMALPADALDDFGRQDRGW
jgi:hypothetical protein